MSSIYQYVRNFLYCTNANLFPIYQMLFYPRWVWNLICYFLLDLIAHKFMIHDWLLHAERKPWWRWCSCSIMRDTDQWPIYLWTPACEKQHTDKGRLKARIIFQLPFSLSNLTSLTWLCLNVCTTMPCSLFSSKKRSSGRSASLK